MAVQSSITEGNISLAIDNANSMYKKAKEIDYPPMPKGVCLTVSHKTHGNREDKNSKVNRAFCRKELPGS